MVCAGSSQVPVLGKGVGSSCGWNVFHRAQCCRCSQDCDDEMKQEKQREARKSPYGTVLEVGVKGRLRTVRGV